MMKQQIKRYFRAFFNIVNPPRQVTANIVTAAPSELLKGRCALVTGGTSGIGYAIAQAFLRAGASVVITGRYQNRLDKACESLRKDGQVYGLVLDNRDVSQFEPAFQSAITLVNIGGGTTD